MFAVATSTNFSVSPSANDFAAEIDRRGGASVIALRGEADIYSAPELRRLVDEALVMGERAVVVDLTETSFVDSTVLGILTAARKRLAAEGGVISVVCRDRNIRKVFEVTGLDRIIAIHGSVDEALAPLSGLTAQ